MTQTQAIVIENLTKSFKGVSVLKGVNLTVPAGTMLALLGPNGAGKTTIVRILSTLLTPDGGTVLVNGRNVVTDTHAVRQSIGLTSQDAAVDEYLTGRENLIMMGRLYHLSRTDSVTRADQLLEQFDLVDASTRAVKTYSGGMRRRLDLAVSLIATPPIVFLDEPTTGLDPRSRLAMWEVIKNLMATGVTILLTTQYLEEADQLANSVAVIDGGKVIAHGTADELKRQVGADRLELVLKDAAALPAAVAAVAPRAAHSHPSKRSLTIAMDHGVADMRGILEQLEGAGIAVESLSLHKPTLDDVFLQLTGQQVAAESDKEYTV